MRSLPLTLLFPACVLPESSVVGLPPSSDGYLADEDACPERSDFLDVQHAPGPGDGHPHPWLEVSCDGDELVVQSNAIPHYRFVPLTPNPLVEQDFVLRLPRSPQVADRAVDVPLLGTVGVSIGGLPLFGPNEGPHPDPFGDPLANGIVDGCLGHTAFIYHHHALAEKCLTPEALVDTPWTLPEPGTAEPSPILGYAIDGFPIYGPRGCVDAECTEVITFESGWVATGDPTTYAWDNHTYVGGAGPEVLDACNGRFGPDGTYRYHATDTFPYLMGCLVGEVDAALLQGSP